MYLPLKTRARTLFSGTRRVDATRYPVLSYRRIQGDEKIHKSVKRSLLYNLISREQEITKNKDP